MDYILTTIIALVRNSCKLLVVIQRQVAVQGIGVRCSDVHRAGNNANNVI